MLRELSTTESMRPWFTQVAQARDGGLLRELSTTESSPMTPLCATLAANLGLLKFAQTLETENGGLLRELSTTESSPMTPLCATLEANRHLRCQYDPPHKMKITSDFSDKLVQQLQRFSKASISGFRV